MRKTLVVAGAHEAETEFGKKVIEKYKRIAEKADSVEIFLVPDNKGSNNNDYERENQAYVQVLSAIQHSNSDFVIDIHQGWYAKNPYYITLIKDASMHGKFNWGEVEAFWNMLENHGINPNACGDFPRPIVLRADNTFTLMTIETMFKTKSDVYLADKLPPQEKHDYLSRGIKKGRHYSKAVNHTADVVNFLHAEFKHKFPHLVRVI